MHPPFFVVDHKVDPPVVPAFSGPAPRRGKPARLCFVTADVQFAPAPLSPEPAPPVVFAPQPTPVPLQLVPPPRETLRDMIGRFLIRTGQRMIFRNHARRI